MKNNIPECINEERQDTELDRKDREMKEKMKEQADKARNSRFNEFKGGDTVLAKNLLKKHKLSPNWLNETFKVIKVYKKSVPLESKDHDRYYRNKVQINKYNGKQIHQERNFATVTKYRDQDDEGMYELCLSRTRAMLQDRRLQRLDSAERVRVKIKPALWK